MRKGKKMERDEAWVRCYCAAVINSHNSHNTAREWADECLAEFDKRFPDAPAPPKKICRCCGVKLHNDNHFYHVNDIWFCDKECFMDWRNNNGRLD